MGGLWLAALAPVAAGLIAMAAARARPVGGRAAVGATCAFLASLVACVLVLDAARVLEPWRGWDARVYCAAERAWDAGRSPYVVANLRPFGVSELSFSYPAFALAALRRLCGGDIARRFTIVYAACAALAFALVAPRPRGWGERVSLALLVGAGFAGTASCLETLNLGLVELVPFAACLAFVARGRLVAAGVALGAAASFKLVPVLFAASFLFLNAPRGAKARALAAAVAVPVVGLAVSYAMSPTLFHDFVASLLGRIPGQHAPILEGVANATNPTFPLALETFLDELHAPRAAFPVALGGLLLIVVVVMRRLAARGLDDVRLFSLGTLFLLLLLPRCKPYALTFAAIPVFHLVRGAPRALAVPALLLAVWLPAVGFNARVARFLEATSPGPGRVWLLTHQVACVALCAALFSAYLLRRADAVKTGAPR